MRFPYPPDGTGPGPPRLVRHFAECLSHDLARDDVRLFRIGGHQHELTQGIDETWNPPRQFIHLLQRRRLEDEAALRRRGVQAVNDVPVRLLRVERLQPVTDLNPLPELSQGGLRELVVQFRLSDEDQLKEFVRLRLQVGQQPDHLQGIHREILGLVDDDNGVSSLPLAGEEKTVQRRDLVLKGPLPSRLNSKILVDRLDEVQGREKRIDDERGLDPIRRPLPLPPVPGGPERGGLSRPALAGHQDKSAPLADPVQEGPQDLLMLGRVVQKPRVRRHTERFFRKREEVKIHNVSTARSYSFFWRGTIESYWSMDNVCTLCHPIPAKKGHPHAYHTEGYPHRSQDRKLPKRLFGLRRFTEEHEAV